ncbi:MAG: UDP-N-acetylmuramoyl-tripeptide--D-alanyl-D-alanine ligase [Candidatus Peribacter sp.]|nr:UDP-N-acetylmuramoyl-tripeptide--D-alanyl-D-alanine ligase [Candidatus Peribacter sp.]
MSLLLILLTLTATLSPLLTFGTLWQVKEWRIDRLRAHFRSEGLFLQTFGFLKPLILLLALPVLLHRWVPHDTWTIGVLSLLTMLTVIRLAANRQPRPVWTMKAIALMGGAVIFVLLAALLVLVLPPEYVPALAVIPLLAPLALLLSWSLFLPVDILLKRRIMRSALALRNRNDHLIVIGITGSVGKTTTKELLLHLLRDQGAASTPAYVNSEIGVARWIIQTLSGASVPKILIVEMGAYRSGEIRRLCQISRPLIGIITFIGSQHMALFGSQEKLLAAKAELFDTLPPEGAGIVNGDSPFAPELRKHAHCRTVTVGTGGPADLEAFDIEETATGLRFRTGNTMITTPLHGTHNVTNILLAMAAAEVLGIKRPEIARRLPSFRPPEHTFSVRAIGSVTLLDDTHNASQASFKASIGWSKSQPAEEKVLLTSGLIELGEDEDRVHSQLGVEAAGVFDRVIFAHARHARSFARGYGKPVEILSKKTQPVSPRSLFICVGRIPEETVRRLLPKS